MTQVFFLLIQQKRNKKMQNTIFINFLTNLIQRTNQKIKYNAYLLSEKQLQMLQLQFKKAMHPASFFSKQLQQDISFILKKDPALLNKEPSEVFLYKSLVVTFLHRIAHHLYQQHETTAARLLSEINKEITGAEIHPGAQIGHSVFIDHPTGLIIGETTIIGDYFHGHGMVLLGSDGKNQTNKRHPTIGNNVTIWPKASVLGNHYIADNVIIGANAFITQDVPPNSTVIGHNILLKKNTQTIKIQLKKYWENIKPQRSNS
ncbi:MAG: serine acetyltransferase [Alphaproteobacteria bacterium]|nr:serine acetyltransferase [Alphaproteobacteria bacterium]